MKSMGCRECDGRVTSTRNGAQAFSAPRPRQSASTRGRHRVLGQRTSRASAMGPHQRPWSAASRRGLGKPGSEVGWFRGGICNWIQIQFRISEIISSEGIDRFVGAEQTLAEPGLISPSETFRFALCASHSDFRSKSWIDRENVAHEVLQEAVRRRVILGVDLTPPFLRGQVMSESLAGLPNAQLLVRVRELVQRGNAVEAELLVHLAAVDARGLYLEEGCSSMFVYCQRVLHFAEGVAYKRIQAARAARRHPEILEAVRCGELHLTAVGLLAPKLTSSNCTELIKAARHRSAEEIRQLLADREPRPAVPTSVRRIPEPAKQARGLQAALPQTPPASRERSAPPAPPLQTTSPKGFTEPLGAERYRVQFTADRALYAQLQELRALMRHQVPDGDLGKILARAVAGLLAQVRKRKFAETPVPKPAPSRPPEQLPSRHIPAAIRRAVWRRDAGRCTYVSAGGRRCDSQEFLEFDHADAWARTRAHSIDAITLRCRAHNQQRARLDFGEPHMAQFRRRSDDDPPSTGFESSSPRASGETPHREVHL